jgi:RNA polymerase sigma-70 factor (ECF subfamily)
VVLEAWRSLLGDPSWLEAPTAPRAALGRAVVTAARARTATGSPAGDALPAGGDEAAVDPERFRDAEAAFPGHWRRYPADWRTVPDSRFRDDRTTGVVRRAFDALPPAMRVVVALRDGDGWSGDDVCSALALSAEAERLLLHRGRSRVRAALERHLDG